MDIFLLEDDDAIAMGLTYSLEPEGYQVTRASTVKEAMRLMAERPFSLYILDLTLPDGSGYDVCRKIKEKGDFPVIILTVMEEEVNVVIGTWGGRLYHKTFPCKRTACQNEKCPSPVYERNGRWSVAVQGTLHLYQ